MAANTGKIHELYNKQSTTRQAIAQRASNIYQGSLRALLFSDASIASQKWTREQNAMHIPEPRARNATEEEIFKLASPLWLFINESANSKLSNFSIFRCAACSIVAQLSYCAIDANERERSTRAKVIPSKLFQKLIRSDYYDVSTAIAGADFPSFEVVRTKRLVAAVVSAHNRYLVGIRGTQYAYDWIINLNILKSRGNDGCHYHRGFLKEANELSSKLSEAITRQSGRRQEKMKKNGFTEPNGEIWLAGHSLGGAVAAILRQIQMPLPVKTCYVFGAPRISGANRPRQEDLTFAICRDLDIVPHCPPRVFSYSDFPQQHSPSGGAHNPVTGIEVYFFLSWLVGLKTSNFLENHSIEQYRKEVICRAKNILPAGSWRPEYDAGLDEL